MLSEPSSPKTQLGLDYVTYLMKHSACREILLKYKRGVGHLDADLMSERILFVHVIAARAKVPKFIRSR